MLMGYLQSGHGRAMSDAYRNIPSMHAPGDERALEKSIVRAVHTRGGGVLLSRRSHAGASGSRGETISRLPRGVTRRGVVMGSSGVRQARRRNGEEPGDGEAVMTKRTGHTTSRDKCWEKRRSNYTERSGP